MKNSTIVKVFLLLVGLGIVFGFLLPWLISATDTFMVCVGVAVILGLLLGAVLWINKLYLEYKNEQDAKKAAQQVAQEKKV